MNILVIGNGFDIAHGLPTQYKDFLNFIRKYYLFKDFDDASDQGCEDFKQIILLKAEKPDLYHEI